MKYFIPQIFLFIIRVIMTAFVVVITIGEIIISFLWELKFKPEYIHWYVHRWRLVEMFQPNLIIEHKWNFVWKTGFHYVWGFKPIK